MPFLRNKSPPAISWPVGREDGTATTSPKSSSSPSSPKSPSSTKSSSRHSYQNSQSSASTAATSIQPEVDSSGTSCHYDADDFFARCREDLDVSDDYPTASTLAQAGDVPIFDANGQSRPFKSIYSGDTVIGERQLVLFIRHFYCGACQSYIKALNASIDRETYFGMPIPTSITVIGCGSPALIAHYKKVTGCPYPIYAEPSRKLYEALGMSWSLSIGSTKPDYMKDTTLPGWLAGQLKQMAKTDGRKKFRGGNWLQIGGEFLFQDGEVVWCHRMRNYRGHAEISQLRRVLEID
ncbi:hypothetical protein B0A49_11103 [Cryomyces minteri]|uniref:Thioredoxin domain-containing protein n=1 Tax=Cryomyces minteri TaxID=331657 RepID=A0A4U0WJR9_9PEZI|nr:hypothetical protein B0A49_11103 [Cryomyces minteri]